MIPALPSPRGPLTSGLFGRLSGGVGPLGRLDEAAGSPWDEDAQLALYTCLELRYRGFTDVDDDWEVEPTLVGLTHRLGRDFLAAVAHEAGPVEGGTAADVRARLVGMAAGDAPPPAGRSPAVPGPSLSQWLHDAGTLDHLRELAIHRSAYQLKEADPHTYALPRLAAGRARSAFAEIQADEYGGGRPGQSHQELFAATLRALGLDDRYGAYLDELPAVTLAPVNLVSLFGTSRRLLAACVGHLALFEMTSVGPMGRYAAAVRRLTGSRAAARFYDVHVEADEHHQRLALDGLVGPYVTAEPDQAAGVIFGARALAVVESRFTGHVLGRWSRGRSSLRRPDRQRPAAA